MTKTTDQSITVFLKSIEIFRDVPDFLLESAANHCKSILYKRGAVVYNKNDPATSMYFIRKGYVMESVYYLDSVNVIVKIKRPGDYFGETAILTDTDYPNTALVTEDAELIRMPKSVFLELANANQNIYKIVIRELVLRLTNSARNMINSMYLNTTGRLAFTILKLTRDADSDRLEVRVTQSALAASSGMARQTAAQILSDWRKEGWITTDRGRIVVHDVDHLLDIITNSEMRC